MISKFRLFIPLSVILFVLCLFSCAAAANPADYEKAKLQLEKLQAGKSGASTWQTCADAFRKVHDDNPDWPLRYAALYRCGLALEGRARVTRTGEDARKAAAVYEQTARTYPSSALADDALFRAAVVYFELLKDKNKALRHLDHIAQRYSRADHAKEAAAYRDSIQGGQGGLPAKEKPVPTGKATANVPTPTTSALRVPKTPHTLAAQLGLSIRTIIIDPGHGGRDPGTMHHGVVEQDITLDIGKRLKTILEKQGYQVHMTRDKSTWVSLADRVRFGRSMKGDLFISIHVNASENPEVAGLETYILDFARTSAASRLAMTENAESGRLGDMDKILTEILTGARTTESRQLAEQIQKNTLQVLKKNKTHTRSGGVKGAPFFVLVGSSMPCVLVEVGYCSHKKEAEHLKDARHRQALAQGIADGVRSYAGSLGKK